MKNIGILFLLFCSLAWGQEQNPKEFSYNEFLGYVKKYHPLAKRAQLEINQAQANLMMARGGFDPKIEADFDQKQFIKIKMPLFIWVLPFLFIVLSLVNIVKETNNQSKKN